jgi:transposase
MEMFAGIDVSKDSLSVCRERNGVRAEAVFKNDSAGHRELIKWLGKKAQVCVEATGVYHLQLGLALRKAGIDVMVVNPRSAKNFAASMNSRSKTDKVDARTLLEQVKRMEFQAWVPPSEVQFELRELARRITELVQMGADEKNRLHAKSTSGLSKTAIRSVQKHIDQIDAHAKVMEREAVRTIKNDALLSEQYSILKGAMGIGDRSAIVLLGELTVVDPTMTKREIVAFAGLDPRVYESGSSVKKTTRISHVGNARIRAALFRVALTAVRSDRGARSFFRHLVARGKKRMQAVVAVMRKMLVGLWIAMQRRVAFDSDALFAASLAQAESSDSAVAAHQPELRQGHPKGRSEAKEPRKRLDHGSAEATHRGNLPLRSA